MVEKNQTSGAVTNIFKSDRMPTKEEYTKIWINLINKLEREKASQ
jgi:preprotein translocase subunit Sss1